MKRIDWRTGITLSLMILGMHAPPAYAQGVTFTDLSDAAGFGGVGNCSWSFAWADWDNDADLDVFITGHLQQASNSQNYFYINNGDGTFSDQLAAIPGGDASTGDCHGVGFFDFDRDGDLDHFITHGTIKSGGQNPNEFYRNDAGTIKNINSTAGTTFQNYRGRSANFIDLDNDGLLDIFSTGKVDEGGGEGNLLLLNDGDDTFTNISVGSGIKIDDQVNFMSNWADYNNDGILDAFVCSWGLLFSGNGDTTWTETTVTAGMTPIEQCKAASWLDYDNDGDQDLYISTLVNDRVHELWENNGDGTFTERAAAAGLDESFAAHGNDVGDPDNDGDLDIYVGTILDPENDHNRFYQNNGDGTFTDVSIAAGTAGFTPFQATDLAFVDVDLDGFQDIFVVNGESGAFQPCEGPYFYFHNDGNSNNWLKFWLRGVSSNIHGIGARITVATADGNSQILDYVGGQHYISQDLLPAHFGLGSNAEALTVTITWPSGVVDTLNNVSANQTLTVIEGQTTGGALTVVTEDLREVTIDSSYSVFAQAIGGTAPYTWALSAGSLPAGVSLNAVTGEISGAPTAIGLFPITLEVSDNVASMDTVDLTLEVLDEPTVILTESVPDGVVGVPYSATLVATGGLLPYSWAVSAGQLPNGLDLDSATGEIFGVPAGARTSFVTIQVTDANGDVDPVDLFVTVVDPGTLMVVTTSLPDATEGVAYSTTLQATGGTPPYTWAITTGVLPSGLSLNAGTGEISGTPTETGSFPITVEVTDDVAATDSAALNIDVLSAPLQVTTTSLPNASLGVAYSAFLQATGGTPPYSWAITVGVLPSGLSLNAGTGEISGTPTELGGFPITVEVTDDVAATDSAALNLDVIDPGDPLAVNTINLPDGLEARTYYGRVQATGGVQPYTWSLFSGALPDGLTLDPNDGLITGDPTVPGDFTFTPQVTDDLGATGTAEFTVTITAAGDPVIVTSGLPEGTMGIDYGANAEAIKGFPPYSWSLASGVLPAGIILGLDGVFSGIPTETGTFQITLQADDSQTGTDTRVVSLTVNADTGLTTFTDVTHPAGLANTFSCSIGLAWGDATNDGLTDLWVFSHVQPTSGGISHLYGNNGDGTFTDLIDQAGEVEPFTADQHGGGFGDVDNDGDQDMFITQGLLFGLNLNSKNEYYISNGDGTFVDLTDEAGVTIIPDEIDPTETSQQITGTNWIDVDNDGDLDLYASGRRDEGTKGSLLYINDTGDGTTFTDVAVAAGLGNYLGDDFSAVWQDYDGDGDIDLFKCLDGLLMQNNGDGTFSDVTIGAGITPVDNCRTGAWGDVDNDGDADLFISTLGSPANLLYENQGGGAFIDVTVTAGVGDQTETQGAQFADYDNDQDLDLLVITGNNTSQSNRLFQNDGTGIFTDVGPAAGVAGHVGGKGQDGAFADYNGDGFLDIAVTNGGGSLPICPNGSYLLFRNNGQSANNWLMIELEGQQSNRDGIGAKVWVTTPDAVVQYHQYFGPQHFDGQDSLPIHFGLGSNTVVSTIDIEWPSGQTDQLSNVAINQLLAVSEGSTTGLPLDVTGVAPNQIMVGTSDQLTVSGQGFLDGAAANICQQPGRVVIDQITFVDSTTLLLDVTVPGGSAAGRCGLRVVNPGGEFDVLPGAVRLTSNDPPPAPTAVNPNQVTQGTSDTLTVTGTGFQSGASVRMCSDGRITIDQTTFVDSTTIIVDVTVDPGAGGACPVRVRNPDGQAGVLPQAVSILP
jgi:hypothetical protein